MSNDPTDPSDDPVDTGPEDELEPTEEEFTDIDEDELEEIESREDEGFLASASQTLSNVKEKYVDFHTADPQSDDWGDQPALGSVSRRGVISGAAQLGVAGFLVAEATDDDGYAVDWSPGEEERPPVGGGAPANQTETTPTDDSVAVDIENPTQYAFETEQELIDETGFCYPGESDTYIGAIDAGTIEEAFNENSYNGEDPTGALSFDEVEMTLDDITPHQDMYAVDVDRKQGNDGDYDLFVQLVGEEDGGMYVTRQGAAQVSEMEFEEVFEGYHECN